MRTILQASFHLCLITGFAQPPGDSATRVVLDEVVISPSKTNERKSETPFTVELLKSREIELLAPQTAADMLTNSGSVFVQKSQMGGGSPVLRGFEASKVLIVVDGVRMNNAIYRSGHLHDVITIDPSMLDHTEVVFGPSSVIYGSDALGGVMHFYSKRPRFGIDSLLVMSSGSIGYVSSNRANTAHLHVNVGSKRWASLTGVTHNIFRTLRAGSVLDPAYDSLFLRTFIVRQTGSGLDTVMPTVDPLLQDPTGYNQLDILQKFSIRQSDRVLHTINLQFSNSSDIPRYDRLTEVSNGLPRFAEWYYGPQIRLLGSFTTNISSQSKLLTKGTLVAAVQGISQDRIWRRFDNPTRITQMEDVTVLSMNADLLKILKTRHEIRYGFEVQHNIVKSDAFATDITDAHPGDAATRYPDGGSTMLNSGAYVGYRFRATPQIIASGGLRFSMTALRAQFLDTTFFHFPFDTIEQRNSALTGNLGIVLKPFKTWRVAINGSSGFHSPNIDDLAKVFDSSPGKLIVPNPDLRPELAYNAELSVEKTWLESVRISTTGWITRLQNAMVIRDYTFNGQDSLMYQGVMSRVQAMQNANKALVIGATGTFAADFSEHFSLISTVTFTRGTYHDAESDSTVPLDHIPPTFGKTALMYSGKNMRMEFYVLYNGWKLIDDYGPSGEDNPQYATVYGMPSWSTLNFKFSRDLTKHFVIQGGVENILDTHYRVFASGISAPGRSFNVMVRAKV